MHSRTHQAQPYSNHIFLPLYIYIPPLHYQLILSQPPPHFQSLLYKWIIHLTKRIRRWQHRGLWYLCDPTHTIIDVKLPCDTNILCVELYVILLANQHIQNLTMDVKQITCSLNNIYLISNHIWQPISRNNHLDKLLIAKIVYHLQYTHQSINIQMFMPKPISSVTTR
jgi:hypothetical protein